MKLSQVAKQKTLNNSYGWEDIKVALEQKILNAADNGRSRIMYTLEIVEFNLVLKTYLFDEGFTFKTIKGPIEGVHDVMIISWDEN